MTDSLNPLGLDHPHWARVAGLPLEDIREALITGYKNGRAFEPTTYHLFSPGRRAGKLLDFGCGIGRNFAALRRHARQIVACDIPEMIAACEHHADCRGIELTSDWKQVRRHEFDVCVATLVLQHIEEPETREFFLGELARIADFLYVNSRCWIDGEDRPNLMAEIVDSGLFTYAKGTISEAEARELEFPSEAHFDAVFRSTLRDSSVRRSGMLFGFLETPGIHHRGADGIVIAQILPPACDRKTIGALVERNEYAELYGHRIRYRDGFYPFAAGRHESWQSIPLALELFEDPDTEWVLWCSIESGPFDFATPLLARLRPYLDRSLLISSSAARTIASAEDPGFSASDMFLIRNTEWSRAFLDLVWRLEDMLPPPSEDASRIRLEQAIAHAVENDLLESRKHVALVPPETLDVFLPGPERYPASRAHPPSGVTKSEPHPGQG